MAQGSCMGQSSLYIVFAMDGIQVPLTLCIYSCLPRVGRPALELSCYSPESLQSERANFQQFHQLVVIRIVRCADRLDALASNLFSLCIPCVSPSLARSFGSDVSCASNLMPEGCFAQ